MITKDISTIEIQNNSFELKLYTMINISFMKQIDFNNPYKNSYVIYSQINQNKQNQNFSS